MTPTAHDSDYIPPGVAALLKKSGEPASRYRELQGVLNELLRYNQSSPSAYLTAALVNSSPDPHKLYSGLVFPKIADSTTVGAEEERRVTGILATFLEDYQSLRLTVEGEFGLLSKPPNTLFATQTDRARRRISAAKRLDQLTVSLTRAYDIQLREILGPPNADSYFSVARQNQ
jgi:hypothetical protein